jgi:hypothetical protein
MIKDITINKTVTVTCDLKNKCNLLHQQCEDADNTNHPFFIDDNFCNDYGGACIYYATVCNNLVGFLSTYYYDNNNVEICLLVDHDYRCNSIGKMLVDAFIEDNTASHVTIGLSRQCPEALSLINRYGFHYTSCENLMYLGKKDYFTKTGICSCNTAKSSDNYFLMGESSSTAHSDFSNQCIFKYSQKDGIVRCYAYGKVIGHCSIIEISDTDCCIYDVEIFKDYRHKGYGLSLVSHALSIIFKNYNNVILHVTSENTSAFNLYTKLGFSCKSSVMYYST